VAQAYAHAAQMLGHEVVLRDLYRGGFDPRLREEETAVLVEQAVCDDIQAEQSLISDADVFAFIYPVWFNLPPAMVTGYVQRVFGPGFGYQSVHHRRPLLRGKSLLSFTSSSAPSGWLSNEGQWADLKHIFDNHLAEVCGLTQMGHFHFNNLTAETSPDLVKAHLSEVGEIFDRLFGPAGAERTGPRDGVSQTLSLRIRWLEPLRSDRHKRRRPWREGVPAKPAERAQYLGAVRTRPARFLFRPA
jgi:NAD(P)H dehydrogenase (quinone)